MILKNVGLQILFALFYVKQSECNLRDKYKYQMNVCGNPIQHDYFYLQTIPLLWLEFRELNIEIEVGLLNTDDYDSLCQKCAITELLEDKWKMIEYLACEAKRYPRKACLCKAGLIGSRKYERCINRGNIFQIFLNRLYYLKKYGKALLEFEKNVIFSENDYPSIRDKICRILEKKGYSCNKRRNIDYQCEIPRECRKYVRND